MSNTKDVGPCVFCHHGCHSRMNSNCDVLFYEKIIVDYSLFRIPCSSLCLTGHLIIGAYGSGHIRVFDVKSGAMLCEVCAHSRWINAIDLSKSNNLVSGFLNDLFLPYGYG